MESERSLIRINKDDHVIGPRGAAVTLVEYADFECTSCADAAEIMADLLESFEGKIQYAFRHYPITEEHEHGMLAALASEAAAMQGKFWAMHNFLFANQDALGQDRLFQYAEALNLDLERFERDMESRRCIDRVDRDIHAAARLGLDEVPSLFVDGKLYTEPLDFESLAVAIQKALDAHEKRAA